MKIFRLSLATVVATLALPGAALAAQVGDTSPVDAVVGSELTLSVTDPTALTPNLTHSRPSRTTSAIAVTSTSSTWTLSIKDAALANAGKLTQGGLGVSALANALQWKATGGTWAGLSGTNATGLTSSGVDTTTVTFQQALGASEDVVAGDAYGLTATYTLVG